MYSCSYLCTAITSASAAARTNIVFYHDDANIWEFTTLATYLDVFHWLSMNFTYVHELLIHYDKFHEILNCKHVHLMYNPRTCKKTFWILTNAYTVFQETYFSMRHVIECLLIRSFCLVSHTRYPGIQNACLVINFILCLWRLDIHHCFQTSLFSIYIFLYLGNVNTLMFVQNRPHFADNIL